MDGAAFARALLCALNDEPTPMIGVVVGVGLGVALAFVWSLARIGDRLRFLLCVMAGLSGAVVVRALLVGPAEPGNLPPRPVGRSLHPPSIPR